MSAWDQSSSVAAGSKLGRTVVVAVPKASWVPCHSREKLQMLGGGLCPEAVCCPLPCPIPLTVGRPERSEAKCHVVQPPREPAHRPGAEFGFCRLSSNGEGREAIDASLVSVRVGLSPGQSGLRSPLGHKALCLSWPCLSHRVVVRAKGEGPLSALEGGWGGRWENRQCHR